MAEVRVAGEWLHSRGNVSGVSWSTRWGSGPCGPDVASCVFAVDPDHDTSNLRVGTSFEVHDGGIVGFGGVIDEVSRDFPRTVKARGWARRAEDFEALSAGAPSSNPRTAATDAVSRGLPWTNPDAFDNTSIGTIGDSVRRLDALLNEWADATGKRWGVDPYGRAFAVTEPTAVSYYLDAAGLDIGVSDEGLFTHIVARYVATVDVDGNPASYGTVTVSDSAALALYGRRENSVDLTGLGAISGGTATTYATAQLALGLRPKWLQRATVTGGRLRSPGGLPAHLGSVKAGDVVRLFNIPSNLGGTRFTAATEVVLGEVSYDSEQPSQITLAPVNLSVRTLADAILAAR